MAAGIQTHIHKFEETLKGYLYEGPLTPFWSLVEHKTKVKRERVALGTSISFLCLRLFMPIYHLNRFTWLYCHLFSSRLG